MSADAVPLPGPLNEDPTEHIGNLVTARRQLAAAVSGIDLGHHDLRIVAWVQGKDISVIATLASLLRRAWEAGIAAGRAERVDEAPAVLAAREEADRYGRALDEIVAAAAAAEVSADDETADPRYALRALLARVESAVGGAR